MREGEEGGEEEGEEGEEGRGGSMMHHLHIMERRKDMPITNSIQMSISHICKHICTYTVLCIKVH